MKYVKLFEDFSPYVLELMKDINMLHLLSKGITKPKIWKNYQCEWEKMNIGKHPKECSSWDDMEYYIKVHNKLNWEGLLLLFDKRPKHQKRYDMFFLYTSQQGLFDYYTDIKTINWFTLEEIKDWFGINDYYANLVYFVTHEEVSPEIQKLWITIK